MSGLDNLQNLSINLSSTPQQQQQQQQQQAQYSQQQALKRRTARDYQFGARIGEGSYSTVYSALDKYTNRTYAIKVLSKRHIVKENKIKYVNIEKTTLNRLGQQHPGIVQLYYTFQDESSLFFVLDFAEYGELLSIIRKFGSLSEPVLKFYMCQIVDAVQFIHLKGVIHRDLKPENILVGHDFNLKITDFGAAKLLGTSDDPSGGEKIDYNSVEGALREVSDSDRKGSFVGTAEYVSPELLKYNICGFESDVWAIGCMLYQFFNGVPPFKGNTEYLTFEKIINLDYSYKSAVPLPPDVVQIIDQILVIDPSQRVTIPQIMGSKWFSDVPWDDQNYIWHRKVPRFEPYGAVSQPPPAMPVVKNGTNRSVSKSNSYQQLQSQIQASEFGFIPSIAAKKSYKPPTTIKKNVPITPSNQMAYNTNNFAQAPVIQSTAPPPQAPPSPTRIQQLQNRNVPPTNIVPSSMQPTNGNSQGRPLPPTPQQQQQPPPLNQQPTPIEKKRASNVRSNAPFAHLVSGSSGTSRVLQPQQQQQQQQPPQQQPMQYQPPAQQQVYRSQEPAAPRNAAALAAAAFASKPTTPVQPSPPVMAHHPPTTAPPPHVHHSHQASVKSPRIGHSKSVVKKSNSVKFKEISELLGEEEKILKMDTLFKLVLSHEYISNSSSEVLDDSVLDKLTTEYKSILQGNSKVVIAVVTNMARVFFVDASLNVMMVDLRANKGADYLMYDYEFENVVDDDGNVIPESDEVFGYLIIELVKEGGDLVFLKRISEKARTRLGDMLKVVDKNGHDVVIGTSHGWIDCLLIAREISLEQSLEVRSPTSGTSSSSNSVYEAKSDKPKKKSSSGSKQVMSKSKKKLPPSGYSTPPQRQSSKFAYAAAAAVHNHK
ncbi:Serine/threonine-protein kinase PKH3 [Candida viswanathii]|uniref:non-specific serine/threonine protein kinase n=1 Tax=Candida viswanathii TaxID=5486 RepID=A0A367XY40_9ASCO|nr:Serine/threonine-protein kinase PKH3 [Candida viswanathii]